jgi:hypothetical protein
VGFASLSDDLPVRLRYSVAPPADLGWGGTAAA